MTWSLHSLPKVDFSGYGLLARTRCNSHLFNERNEMKLLNRPVCSAAAAAALVIASAQASAAAIDVSAVTTDIAAQAVPVGLVGAAVLLIFLAVKAFKWVRAALS